jgi:salicylate hydroxylase
MGKDGHVLTFQVNHGEKLNVVAFRTDPNEWSDPTKLTKTAHRQDALDDFKGYNSTVTNLLKLTEETLSVVCPTLCICNDRILIFAVGHLRPW